MNVSADGGGGMYLDSESIRQSQRSLGSMPIRVPCDGGDATVYWARLIEGQSESLLTGCTKHTVYEIEYAFRRPLTIRIGERQISIPEGSFLIVPPGVVHQIIGSESDGVKFILGFMPGETKKALRVAENVQESTVIRGLAEILAQMSDSGRELLHALLRSIALAFMDVIPAQGVPVQHNDDREQRVRRFITFVESANGVGVSVKDGAKLVSLSERQLFRCCLAVAGRTPSDIIRDARAKYIRACLRGTRLSLSEIADLSGFQSEYAMAKFFRRNEGMLPSAFRRGNEENEARGDGKIDKA